MQQYSQTKQLASLYNWWLSHNSLQLDIFIIDMYRPEKNIHFPASWAKVSFSRVDFPPVWKGFPYVYLYFFPPNHKISLQGASCVACMGLHVFFQAWMCIIVFVGYVKPWLNEKKHTQKLLINLGDLLTNLSMKVLDVQSASSCKRNRQFQSWQSDTIRNIIAGHITLQLPTYLTTH